MVQTRKSGPTGPWDAAVLAELESMDMTWTGTCQAMTTDPWSGAVLSRRFVELVSVAICVACTNLDRTGARRHIRAALEAGASQEEVLTVIKMATVMAIHSCSLGAPILLEEAADAGVALPARADVPTPACDKMHAIGQWNQAWDPFLALDPAWTDAFMATGAGIYGSKVFTPKETELLSIAFDASFTHMYAPGTRRHIRNALAAGASVAEIMEILKICVAQGAAASNLGVPILAEEVMRREEAARSSNA
ncbi:MAG: carboxymuconolactone decarboxylase family protein [Amaricoccus sp.]